MASVFRWAREPSVLVKSENILSIRWDSNLETGYWWVEKSEEVVGNGYEQTKGNKRSYASSA